MITARRFALFSAFLYLGFILIIARLFYWQVIKSSELTNQVRFQHEVGYKLSARRGNIIASDNNYLVIDEQGYLIYADLKEIDESPQVISQKLAPILTDNILGEGEVKSEEERLTALLTKKKVVWVPLKHKVNSDLKSNIAALDIKGIGWEEEDLRYYPEASSAAHLLGFVGKNSEGEDTGYFGLEGYYDLALAGKPGFLQREKDVRGSPIMADSTKKVGAISGVDLITYIDKTVQLTVERELKKGLDKYQATSGSVIVMNPNSGGIVAMSSLPSYEPWKYWDYSDKYFLNPVISSSFEPGSVFKVVVMASALDSGLLEPDSLCEICSGPLRIDKYNIETWDKKYHSDSTMTEVIINSDNVGMAYVAKKMGISQLNNYLRKFGFGEETGIDLQGEFAPSLRKEEEWSEIDLVVAGFGQGIAVTPIQIIRAVGAIANDGMMLKPKVVDRITWENKDEKVGNTESKRVISKSAADKITAMMVQAAEKGEAKWTYARGFNVAGKTGTAQIPIAGHYDEEKTIASFIGFAPADNPKFIMLVTLKEPKSSPWASETAAPLWYAIAKDLFLYYGIQPEN